MIEIIIISVYLPVVSHQLGLLLVKVLPYAGKMTVCSLQWTLLLGTCMRVDWQCHQQTHPSVLSLGAGMDFPKIINHTPF